MELAAGGELFRRLSKKESFRPAVAKFYATEIFSAGARTITRLRVSRLEAGERDAGRRRALQTGGLWVRGAARRAGAHPHHMRHACLPFSGAGTYVRARTPLSTI